MSRPRLSVRKLPLQRVQEGDEGRQCLVEGVEIGIGAHLHLHQDDERPILRSCGNDDN